MKLTRQHKYTILSAIMREVGDPPEFAELEKKAQKYYVKCLPEAAKAVFTDKNHSLYPYIYIQKHYLRGCLPESLVNNKDSYFFGQRYATFYQTSHPQINVMLTLNPRHEVVGDLSGYLLKNGDAFAELQGLILAAEDFFEKKAELYNQVNGLLTANGTWDKFAKVAPKFVEYLPLKTGVVSTDRTLPVVSSTALSLFESLQQRKC